jgi:hypothetical protein
MDDSLITQALRDSAPSPQATTPAAQAEIDHMIVQTRSIAQGRRRNRRRITWAALPVLAVLPVGLAFTGGFDVRLVPDYVIPVSYVTDTGLSVDCEIELFNGETNYVETNHEAVDHYRSVDWTGVGQRIYDRALQYEARAEISPWAQAENDVLMDGAPDEIFSNAGMGSSSTCSGQLH